MNALETIRADIPDFPGCEGENECRLSDEQVRSFVGERLEPWTARELSPEERDLYDRVIYRCEFMNQEAFRIFDEDRSEQRIAAVLEADAALLTASKKLDPNAQNAVEALKAIDAAFDQRDAAMRSK